MEIITTRCQPLPFVAPSSLSLDQSFRLYGGRNINNNINNYIGTRFSASSFWPSREPAVLQSLSEAVAHKHRSRIGARAETATWPPSVGAPSTHLASIILAGVWWARARERERERNVRRFNTLGLHLPTSKVDLRLKISLPSELRPSEFLSNQNIAIEVRHSPTTAAAQEDSVVSSSGLVASSLKVE